MTEVNLALEDNPELVNNDPYGDGWMAVIEPADPELPSARCSMPRHTVALIEG